MKISDYIVERISQLGIDTVFGYTGGSIADLVDSIYRSGVVHFLENYHEQASSFAANAYAMITGKIGVSIATSGPGACNLISGIANAYFDSIPCLFITGNVHSYTNNIRTSKRQNAFQETDVVSMVKNITKFSAYISKPEQIGIFLDKALFWAAEGRPGPVLLDIPYDIQRSDIIVEDLPRWSPEDKECTYPDWSATISLLSKAHRPIVLLGGGSCSATAALRNFVKTRPIPIVTSLRGLDIIPHNWPNYIGFIGSYGSRVSNLAIHYSDLLIVLGSRLDERQIGFCKEEFAPNASIIQVDIDPDELGKKVNVAFPCLGSVDTFVRQAEKLIPPGAPNCYKWIRLLNKWKYKYDCISESDSIGLRADKILRLFSTHLKDEKLIFCADVGQNQMFAARGLYLTEEKYLLNSSGLGAMGYSLPAAIGCACAKPGVRIVSCNGDGGIQMNIQELQTIARENFSIMVLVFNNCGLGLIKRLQEKLFSGRFYASEIGYSNPDFGGIAAAYGLPYFHISNEKSCLDALDFMSRHRNGLIEISLDSNQPNDPEPGESILKQLPLLSFDEWHNFISDLEEI